MSGRIHAFFGEGFRVFFLAAGLYAVFSVAVWEVWLGVHAAGGMVVNTPFAQAPHLWHAHEMIFGYATAALGGFFLTAVPNWTGAKAARHGFIGAASGIWLAGRMAMWWSASLDPGLVATVDLAFLPILAAKIATQLFRRPKPQNVMFLGLLSIVWTGNLLVHLEWAGVIDDGVQPGLRVGLYGLAALIVVLGGRVTPAFTRNAMARAGIGEGLPRSRPALDAAGIGSAIAVPLTVGFGLAEDVIAIVALIAGVTQLLRLAHWRTAWTLSQPILWSLHLGFAMLGLGYILLGVAYLGMASEVAALHVTGVGAVGGMTLAVMSRAILGHSGMPLVAPRFVAVAYGLVAAAALVRAVGASAALDWYFTAVLIAGALWIAAFALFVLVFWRPLTAPRVRTPLDERQGGSPLPARGSPPNDEGAE